MDELLNETLDRIRGGSIDAGWWQSLLDRFSQQYIAPDFLTKPALQEWLGEESVAQDLKTIATWRIMATAQDEAAPRDRLARTYANHTGDARHFADGPIDAAVAILAAGYIEAIRTDPRATAGMLQTGVSRIDERLDYLTQCIPPIADSATRRTHTAITERELARILAARAVIPARTRSDVQALLRRLDSGDLAATDAEVKHDVRYWTARLCASDSKTLDVARELREQIRDHEPDRDLSIVDALICDLDGDSDGAIRLLRDRDDPDSRTALFGVLARSRGVRTALGQFAEAIAACNDRVFTAVGWRNWATSMTEVGQWQEAADVLARLDDPWSGAPALALVEGIINAQLLLPPERRSATDEVRIFAGISPIQGERAEAAHARATVCLELAKSGLEEVADADLERFVSDWSWWLRLMDPNAESPRDAHDGVRLALERDAPDVRVVPFAWAFGVSFDTEPLRRFLSRREKLGGLSAEELRAECLLYLVDMNSGRISVREVIRYLETSQARLTREFPVGLLTAARIDALLRDNQAARARSFLAEMRDDLNDVEAMRLSAVIDVHEGRDPRTAFERAYDETRDPADLPNLIRCLKQADDREALLPLLEESVAQHCTVENVKELVACLSGRPFFDHRRIVELLDTNSDLVERSSDLKGAMAWALFHSGRLFEARELNDHLLNGPRAADALALDINIAVASGNWEHLPAIVEREWPRRNELTAETLLSLAQISGRQGRSPERALRLAKLAAGKAPENPHVLAASHWLHFHLGRDEEADADWLSRAFELSSGDDGPLWSMDFRTVVTQWIPERRERLAEIEKQWLDGRIPTGMAAAFFNVPLTRLLVEMPESNEDIVDRRGGVSVPVVFGGRPPVELEVDWSIGMDITSILVLHNLDLLETVFEVFHRIKLAPDIMVCLFAEQDRVRFHQPSRVSDGQQVRNLCNLQRLRVVDAPEAPADAIVGEVGRELAALLRAARRDGGKVVCVLPIHRPGSLMEEEADTSDWADLIMSVPDLCELLFRHGRIDAESHSRAQLFLQAQNQPEPGDPETPILDGAIYLDELALSYLQSAKVLDRIAAAPLDLRIHSNVLRHMDELIRVGESGEILAAKIDGIRHVLRSAVESGRASYLPREVDPESPVLYLHDQFATTQSLLAGACHCDALCIDDRFVNSNVQFEVTEDAERTLPIACTLDILRYLVSGGHLATDRLWSIRHKLRSGGFVFIPFEADELIHWLKTVPVDNDRLTEGAELRAIRQSMVQSNTIGLTNAAEIFALSVDVTQTCVAAIRSLWRDDSLTTESIAVLSDWIWRHLVLPVPGSHGSIEQERSDAWNREWTLRRICIVLLPPGIESPDRRSSYADWVDATVLGPLRSANADVIEQALTSICNMIADRNDTSDIFGNVFLVHLPDTSRRFLLMHYPDEARRWGFETRTMFNLDADVSIVDQELFSAARHALSAMEQTSVRSPEGHEISLIPDPNNNHIVLAYPGAEGDIRSSMPDLGILSSDPQARVTTLHKMLERFGPTAPDMRLLHSELELREPNETELATIFREAAWGVAAVQGALLRKLNSSQPIGMHDVLPQEIAYFEGFVGPQPETRDPEQYIRDVLIPYRKFLLERDLSRGLDICCLGALRDDLCPGKWIVHLDDDAVWQALTRCSAEGSPISLLGALDVALYRQRDARFRAYAAEAVTKLCGETFGRQPDIDMYHLVWMFVRFAFNRINLIENGSKQPGFWKRMCSWMQAQFIARALSEAPAPLDMDSLEEWSMSGMALVGAYAELVDVREEPMLLFSERSPASDFRCEVLGRLVALRSRHATEGRHIPNSSEIDQALERAEEQGNLLKCYFPGPLEGHRCPVASTPEDLEGILVDTVPNVSLPASWHLIANTSHLHSLRESELIVARNALAGIPQSGDEREKQDILFSLEIASIVAKTNRDVSLADAVADAVAKISTRVSNENDIWMILVICLQAAAAFEEHDAWFDWIEERMARIAYCLPGPPNRAVRILLEHLDAMEAILPIGSWFHRRARFIASAGAELRP